VTGSSEQLVQGQPNLTRVNEVSRGLSLFIETELSTVWLVKRLKRAPVLGKSNKKAAFCLLFVGLNKKEVACRGESRRP